MEFADMQVVEASDKCFYLNDFILTVYHEIVVQVGTFKITAYYTVD